ncbi:MAG: protein kinase [Myxococcota bacterium]
MIAASPENPEGGFESSAGEHSEATEFRSLGPNVGRYRLCFEIAAGGMAMVYLARARGAEAFEKVVALKCIHRHLAREASFIEMFLDEARIASRIHHANVCNVFDFGEVNGTYFIAMEYLYGESLQRVIRSIAGSETERRATCMPLYAARIVADAAEGLHAAHELVGDDGQPLQVVHRDVSPQNLFLTFSGTTKVVDFGIASARERVHHTRTGQVKGKFAYMAPEQQYRTGIDRRADIWSLGVVLWEFLCCARLFRKSTDAETMQAVLVREIPPPSKLNPNVSPELDAIVLRALERDPENRFPTAREMSRALSTYIARSGTPAGLPELSDWMKRLFLGGEQKKRELVRTAQEMGIADSALAREVHPPTTSEQETVAIVPPAISTLPTKIETVRVAGRRTAPMAIGVLLFFPLVLAVSFIVSRGSVPDDVNHKALLPIVPEAPPTAEEPTVHPAELEARPPRSAVDAPAANVARPTRSSSTVEEPPSNPEADRGSASPTVSMHSAVRATGRLAVVTPGGWANVFNAQGRPLGPTPLVVQLPAGPQAVILRMYGDGPPIRRTVRVRPGQTQRMIVRAP